MNKASGRQVNKIIQERLIELKTQQLRERGLSGF